MPADQPGLACAQAMRPAVQKLGPMCVQTRNAAGESEIAPMPAFTIGGPVRTPPPRLAAPVDVPADVPRPVVPAPAVVPPPAAAPAVTAAAPEAQPTADAQPSPAQQAPQAAVAPEAELVVARRDSAAGVDPDQDALATKAMPAVPGTSPPAAAECDPPPAGSPATAAVQDCAAQSEMDEPAEASLAIAESAAEVIPPGQPSDAAAVAATREHAAEAGVPDANPGMAPESFINSQAGSAPVSDPACGPAAAPPVGSSVGAPAAVSDWPVAAPAVEDDLAVFHVGSYEVSGAQPMELGPADDVAGHGSVSSPTAAVAAQRAAFEAALGIASEPDCDTIAATRPRSGPLDGGLRESHAAAPAAQQQLTVQQSMMGGPQALVSDPVAMFLNDGPDQ